MIQIFGCKRMPKTNVFCKQVLIKNIFKTQNIREDNVSFNVRMKQYYYMINLEVMWCIIFLLLLSKVIHLIFIYLYDNGLLSGSVELHLPKSACHEAPGVRLHPFSGLDLDLIARGYLRRIPRKHFIESGSLSLLSPSAITTRRAVHLEEGKPCCKLIRFLAAISTHGNVMEVNQERKPGLTTSCHLLQPSRHLMSCLALLLDLEGTVECAFMCVWGGHYSALYPAYMFPRSGLSPGVITLV